MSNARDDKDGLKHNGRWRSESVVSPGEKSVRCTTLRRTTPPPSSISPRCSNLPISRTSRSFSNLSPVRRLYRKKGTFKEAWQFLEKRGPSSPMTRPRTCWAKSITASVHPARAGQVRRGAEDRIQRLPQIEALERASEVADVQLLVQLLPPFGMAGEAEDFFMDALSSYRRVEDRIGIGTFTTTSDCSIRTRAGGTARSPLFEVARAGKSLGLTQHLIAFSSHRRCLREASPLHRCAQRVLQRGDDGGASRRREQACQGGPHGGRTHTARGSSARREADSPRPGARQ